MKTDVEIAQEAVIRPIREIAEKLNISIRTVETRMYRALLALKEKISQKSFFILLNMSGVRK